jgi:voltage-gated sodium channel
LVFYTIFVVELIFKLGGLGFKEYFKDKFNAFDFLIVVVSSIDVAFTISNISFL